LTLQTGKLQAQAAIDGLITAGATNLIAANRLALSLALEDTAAANMHIVILTDGEPDNRRQVLPEFFKAIAPLHIARCAGRHHGACVSAFGFGYDMNSVRSPTMVRCFYLNSRHFAGAAAADEHRRPRSCVLRSRTRNM
jgi:hypothetical protein